MDIDLSKVREYGNLELLARQLVEGFITGLHRSPYHGFSVEFAEHKQYNPGESTRHIDWKVYSRTDRIYTKRYEEETNLRCQIVIDSSSSMFYPEETNGKFVFSVLATACLAYLLQKQRDAVGVTTFSDVIEMKTPIKSTPAHFHSLLNQLQGLMGRENRNKRTNAAKVLDELAEQVHRRSLFIIFSDMLDQPENLPALFSALQHLKHNKHEIVLFHVVDGPTELDFDFKELPYEFIDVETGEKLKIRPTEVREEYKESIGAYFKSVALKCAQFKIDYVPVDISKNIDQILLPYLVKRRRMR